MCFNKVMMEPPHRSHEVVAAEEIDGEKRGAGATFSDALKVGFIFTC